MKFDFSPSKPATLRLYIQAAFAMFFVYVGWEFYQYYLWATGEGQFYPKPPAVGAFLPIGALVSFKYLLGTGTWDTVHPAALAIFLMAMLLALAARKGFCGYFCPIGFVTVRLDRIGRKLGISRRPPKYLSWLLSIPKYLILGFFIWAILINMDIPSIRGFINSPYNMVVDSKMLTLFLHPSSTTLISLGVIGIGSMLIPGFWCRGFCPYGALLGLFSFFSPLAVNRDQSSCINCGRCSQACPTRIPVHTLQRVNSPECQGCLECVSACPQKGCLQVKAGYIGKKTELPFWSIPALSLGILCFCYMAALATGHWYSDLPPEMIKIMHKNLNMISHY